MIKECRMNCLLHCGVGVIRHVFSWKEMLCLLDRCLSTFSSSFLQSSDLPNCDMLVPLCVYGVKDDLMAYSTRADRMGVRDNRESLIGHTKMMRYHSNHNMTTVATKVWAEISCELWTHSPSVEQSQSKLQPCCTHRGRKGWGSGCATLQSACFICQEQTSALTASAHLHNSWCRPGAERRPLLGQASKPIHSLILLGFQYKCTLKRRLLFQPLFASCACFCKLFLWKTG